MAAVLGVSAQKFFVRNLVERCVYSGAEDDVAKFLTEFRYRPWEFDVDTLDKIAEENGLFFDDVIGQYMAF